MLIISCMSRFVPHNWIRCGRLSSVEALGLSSSGGPFSCTDDAYVSRECSCSSIATRLGYHVGAVCQRESSCSSIATRLDYHVGAVCQRECSCLRIATRLDHHVVKNAGNFLHVEGRSNTIGFVVIGSHQLELLWIEFKW